MKKECQRLETDQKETANEKGKMSCTVSTAHLPLLTVMRFFSGRCSEGNLQVMMLLQQMKTVGQHFCSVFHL